MNGFFKDFRRLSMFLRRKFLTVFKAKFFKPKVHFRSHFSFGCVYVVFFGSLWLLLLSSFIAAGTQSTFLRFYSNWFCSRGSPNFFAFEKQSAQKYVYLIPFPHLHPFFLDSLNNGSNYPAMQTKSDKNKLISVNTLKSTMKCLSKYFFINSYNL